MQNIACQILFTNRFILGCTIFDTGLIGGFWVLSFLARHMGSILLDTQVKKGNGLEDSVEDIIDQDAVGGEVEMELEEVCEKELLLPPREGGMSRHDDKTRRKVQWNDRNGHSLVQVLEFDPSYQSDEDLDEDLDYCICTIM